MFDLSQQLAEAVNAASVFVYGIHARLLILSLRPRMLQSELFFNHISLALIFTTFHTFFKCIFFIKFIFLHFLDLNFQKGTC